jgi:hypothetical protein
MRLSSGMGDSAAVVDVDDLDRVAALLRSDASLAGDRVRGER